VINRFAEKVIIAPDDIYKKYRFGVNVDNHGSPKGIRTPVTAVKGRCPRPLDDGTVMQWILKNGGSSETRTPDTLIKSQVLYRLS